MQRPLTFDITGAEIQISGYVVLRTDTRLRCHGGVAMDIREDATFLSHSNCVALKYVMQAKVGMRLIYHLPNPRKLMIDLRVASAIYKHYRQVCTNTSVCYFELS